MIQFCSVLQVYKRDHLFILVAGQLTTMWNFNFGSLPYMTCAHGRRFQAFLKSALFLLLFGRPVHTVEEKILPI